MSHESEGEIIVLNNFKALKHDLLIFYKKKEVLNKSKKSLTKQREAVL